VIIIVVLWMQVPDQHWLMVVGMLVVSDSRQFGVPGGARVGASWIYRVCVFMMGAGRVCRTVWYFKRVIGCRVSIGFVRVWCRRGVVVCCCVVCVFHSCVVVSCVDGVVLCGVCDSFVCCGSVMC